MNAHRNRSRTCDRAAIAVVRPARGSVSSARPGAGKHGACPTLGTIERLDPRFDKLVPQDARVERIAEGFDWSEGPVWDRSRKVLLFSDVPMNTVFQWQEGKGVERLPQAQRLHRIGPARR